MTPNQIATNFTLVAMADMDDPRQANAAVRIMLRTIPALRDHLSGQFETAGCDQHSVFIGFRDFFKASLLSAGVDEPTEEVSDDDILEDGVEDDEDLNEEDQFIVEGSLDASVRQLKELAMGKVTAGVIRNKGKFIPLDDIDLPGDADDEEKVRAKKPTKLAAVTNTRTKPSAPALTSEPKRRNVMGKLGQ